MLLSEDACMVTYNRLYTSSNKVCVNNQTITSHGMEWYIECLSEAGWATIELKTSIDSWCMPIEHEINKLEVYIAQNLKTKNGCGYVHFFFETVNLMRHMCTHELKCVGQHTFLTILCIVNVVSCQVVQVNVMLQIHLKCKDVYTQSFVLYREGRSIIFISTQCYECVAKY